MRDSERSAYLFLSLLQAGAGRSVTSRLRDLGAAEVLRMPADELAARAGIGERGLNVLRALRRSFHSAEISARLAERGIKFLTPVDEGYPRLLGETPDPPPALFVRGEIPETRAVAVVGARKASATGLETARKLGRALGERGVCVVSGLAIGVDAAAHRGALEAGGPTVAVLGCGIDVVYPRDNRELFASVAGNGALVSEYFLGEAPLAWRFPARNRVIAGLSAAVVVVEAAVRSGALITARHAAEAGRDVWAVPGPVGAREATGANKLLADGATVLWDITEFADAVGPAVARSRGAGRDCGAASPPGLPGVEGSVLAAVGFEPTGVETVAARSGVGMGKLLSALTMLELKGYVARGPGGAYLRRPTT